MIIVMSGQATEEQVNSVVEKLTKLGFGIHLSKGVERTVIGAIGDKRLINIEQLESQTGVEQVIHILKPYKLAGREIQKEDSAIKIRDWLKVGAGQDLLMAAGPCAVESQAQISEIAAEIKKLGANCLRGGAFKPRTSPYAFQGLGGEGLKFIQNAAKAVGLPMVTEVMDTRDVELVAEYADIMQIGARNMQNFALLKEVGRIDKPVVLKRGPSATIEEWLLSAEYILSEGNPRVILCERGIRTFETYTRNTLDLSAVAIAKKESHLPVIADPSHGTGRWFLVEPMALAAIMAGADGLMVEVHPKPAESVSDGPQTLNYERFAQLMKQLKNLTGLLGRKIPTS